MTRERATNRETFCLGYRQGLRNFAVTSSCIDDRVWMDGFDFGKEQRQKPKPLTPIAAWRIFSKKPQVYV